MKPVVVGLLIGLTTPLVQAHEHLVAGATSTDADAALVFQNAGDFGGDSGFVFSLTVGTTNDAYLGFYYTGEYSRFR